MKISTKITASALLLFSFGVQSFAQTNSQDSVYYWKNGKIQRTGAWLDGTEQGQWTYYDSLGNKIQESQFLRGRLNGKNIIYKNGVKVQEATYVLNELWGPYTEWNEDGKKMLEGFYKRNKQDSTWKYYYPSGQLRREYFYKGDSVKLISNCYIRGGCTVSGGNGIFQETWPNGSIKIQGNYKDGNKEGEWVSNFENGKLQSKGCYRNGEKVGNWIEYYQNGQIKEKIDRTSAKYNSYYENGQAKEEGFYRNEEKHGTWTTWNSNGKIVKKNVYEIGKLQGLQEIWSEDGSIKLSEIEYKDNQKNGKAIWWLPNGNKDMEGYFVNDLQDGEWIYYRQDNGKVGNNGKFEKGEKTGHWDWFYADGSKWKEGNYEHNKKVGTWTFYYENGQKEHEGNFENNLEQGEFIQWFENGSTMTIGYFDKGLMTGLWTGWYETNPNQKKYEVNYKKGVNHGSATYWNENGKLQSEKNFANGQLHGLFNTYFVNGKLNISGQYTQGKMDGAWKYYNESGVCEREINFKDERPSGNWTIRYKEGPTKEESTYKNGERHGNYKAYTVRGELIYFAKYKKGLVKKVKVDKRNNASTTR